MVTNKDLTEEQSFEELHPTENDSLESNKTFLRKILKNLGSSFDQQEMNKT